MQFRPMRRSAQQLSRQECEEILRRGSSGVLAVLGDGGYPYAVPLSYVYHAGALYFHCARTGHKLDALHSCGKVSFCVIDQDEVVPEAYSTRYRSVIAFGRAHILEQEAEIRAAIERLALKYAPDDRAEHRAAEIEAGYAALCMIRLEIEHLTGKESAALARERSV